MRSVLTLIAVAAVLLTAASQVSSQEGTSEAGRAARQAGENQAAKPAELSSNQMLMRDKLVQMNRVLEGITLHKFEQVEDAAETLRMISRATSWHVADPTPRYKRLAKSFQEQATDLKRHAGEQDADAATLDLVRLNITCAECHHHMREHDEAAQRGD